MDRQINYKFSTHFLKIIANIIVWTIIICLIIIALFLGYYLVASKISEKKERFQPPIALYTIISPSMEPNIKVYDVIVDVKVKDASKIKKGDVITFISQSSMSKDMTVTHRVDEVVKNGDGSIAFKTKGDNNNSSDPALVTEDYIIGKTLFRVPQLGRLQFILLGKGGWVFLIIIPALIILFRDIMKLIRLNKVKNNMLIISDDEKIDLEKLRWEKERKKKLKKKLLSEENNDTIIDTEFKSRIVGRKNSKNMELPKLKDE